VRCLHGQVDEAVHVLDRARALCDQGNLPVWMPWIASFLGYGHALAGRVDQGLAYLERAAEQAAATSRRVDQALFVARLGEATLLAHDFEGAVRHVRLAHRLAREHKERPHEAYCEWLFARISAGQAPPDRSDGEAHYQAAILLAAELGMRPLVAHCHLGLGELHRRTGQRAQAQGHFTTATTMYREMDMRFWLEKGDVELKQLS